MFLNVSLANTQGRGSIFVVVAVVVVGVVVVGVVVVIVVVVVVVIIGVGAAAT